MPTSVATTTNSLHRTYTRTHYFLTLQQRLRSAVAHLHAGGLVHGDLRANNVLVVGNRVCLLDFDWSGPAGVQCYPGFMNHGEIDWPAGASDGEPLQVEHDNVWLARMLGN
jgi:serine/threonine protein kinase